MVKAQDKTRCPCCSLLVRLCICALIPRVENRTRLVLVLNHREKRQRTNTGMLAARSLVHSEVHVFGEKDQPFDVRSTVASDAVNLVLYPADGAVPLTDEFCRSLPASVRLIVPDGNWAQAARIRRKLPHAAVTYVTLPVGPPSEYRLRRAAKDLPGGLSTLEAVARALHAIEGPGVSAPLLGIFRTFVGRMLWERGKLPASEVHGGLPPG